ncbi:Helix-turn-helix domain-containing protein [Thermoactinomyces sp. DSM 45891]|uniref:tetratricopeptide repeat protein n=1 Tax=Thermoactinomyces sp. DSM 45891 TaxID=1761907 RepID=UPI00091E8410|nr:tetratricopeptide repeat protein [Thermoactinomyces sp. DSM 45891]SFX12437.1 Helix-turn-helix domain-containing protein [Thermoactinomyces sp. DSM 45891]
MKEYIYIHAELGKQIRLARKKKSLRQEDLADDLISTGTISKIECGSHHIGKEKLQYLCDKLEIGFDSLLHTEERQEQQQHLNDQIVMMGIEMKGTIDPELSWEEIRTLKYTKDDPRICNVTYLRGRYYEYKKKWDYARLNYQQCIALLDQHKELHSTNLASICYYALGRTHYLDNQVEEALQHTIAAEQCFHPNGEKAHMIHFFQIAKAIYLERLNVTEEAYVIINELWEQKEQIDSSEVLLNLYEVRARLFNRMEHYDKAIECALVGIEKAKYNYAYDRLCELWTVLGDGLMKKGMWSDAEYAYGCSLQLESKLKKKQPIVVANTKLGLLHLKRNNITEAEEVLKRAVTLASYTTDAMDYVEALIIYGECQYVQKKYPKAIEWWEKALKIAEDKGLSKHKRRILMKLANVCANYDKKKYQFYIDKFLRISVQLETSKQ